MLRQGAWAIPINCNNPYWRQLLDQAALHDRDICLAFRAYSQALACSNALSKALALCCHSGVSPMLLLALGAVVSLLLLLVLAAIVGTIIRWTSSRRCSAAVALATAAAEELRRTHPTQYPSAPHTWTDGAALDMPAYCIACFRPVHPTADARCCQLCSVICHDGCAKHVPRNCKAVAAPGTDYALHCWKPSAAVQQKQQEDVGQDVALQVCLYCQQPCEMGPLATEAVWSCVTCSAVCHVGCYLEAHPGCFSTKVAAALRQGDAINLGTFGGGMGFSSGLASDGSRPGSPRGPRHRGRRGRGAGGGHSPRRRKARRAGERQREAVAAAAQAMEARPGSHKRRLSGSDLPLLPEGQPATGALLLDGAAAYYGDSAASQTDGGEGDNPPLHRPVGGPRVNRGPKQWRQAPAAAGTGPQAARGGPLTTIQSPAVRDQQGTELLELDKCTLGRHWAMTLPAHCVQAKAAKPPVPPSGDDKKANQALAGVAPPLAGASSTDVVPGGKRRRTSKSDGGGMGPQGPSRAVRRKWWGARQTLWQTHTIGTLPVGCRPLLVFLNTRSGPQLGSLLKRNFLRELNPLQVVELPADPPDHALACFADVASLRVLVVGGDGTVGWVLGALDSLKESMAARGRLDWQLPPVALMPLGTGNDLARCLGWGGGVKGAWQRSLQGLFDDIASASMVLLDRWDVRAVPVAVPGRGPVAEGAGGGKHVVMNNYFGIGVDARIALDFHQLRDSFPEFFQSQVGNKLWYTGVGAATVVEGAGGDLSDKIKVLCDGAHVWLPRRLQGLLLLNIPSYMGGVDLWASSSPPGLPALNDLVLEAQGAGRGPLGGPWEDTSPLGRGSDGGVGKGGLRRVMASAPDLQSHGVGNPPLARSASSTSSDVPTEGGLPRTVSDTANGFAVRTSKASVTRGQSMSDGLIEVVGVYGAWHLGQLQVGLNRAVRLAQGSRIQVTTSEELPVQIDGEPWLQPASDITVSFKGQAVMLRKVDSPLAARMMGTFSSVLEDAARRGVISNAQRHALATEVSARATPLL